MVQEPAEHDEVMGRVVDVVRGIAYHDGAIAADTTFAELGIDSLGLVELALVIEELWAVELRPGDYERLQTLDDVVELIVNRRS